MADIELVIKIPKYVYNTIVANDGYIADCDNEKVGMAIIKGTPLPKGHGSLVDVKQVAMALVFHDFLKDNITCGDVAKILDMATIIEADNTESEDKE